MYGDIVKKVIPTSLLLSNRELICFLVSNGNANDPLKEDEKILCDFLRERGNKTANALFVEKLGWLDDELARKNKQPYVYVTPDKQYSEVNSDLQIRYVENPNVYSQNMETAGKLVDNDELRDALKENGIGRPSTRAAIIETLFKRNYIRKEKKNLIATPTGVELIQIILEELCKSAELTGIWEKKLREIEKRTYNAGQFLEELKQMVSEIVMSVLSDNSNRHITIQAPAPEKGGKNSASSASASDKPKKEPKKRAPRKSAAKKTETATTDSLPAAAEQPASVVQADELVGQPCPLCGKGTVIKGKTAYGCSEWKSGCTFRKPF